MLNFAFALHEKMCAVRTADKKSLNIWCVLLFSSCYNEATWAVLTLFP